LGVEVEEKAMGLDHSIVGLDKQLYFWFLVSGFRFPSSTSNFDWILTANVLNPFVAAYRNDPIFQEVGPRKAVFRHRAGGVFFLSVDQAGR
jgi:hypothetical protein